MTNERPIIMSGESVRAILNGRKTQTRRVLKEISVDVVSIEHEGNNIWRPYYSYAADCGRIVHKHQPKSWTHKCPYGKVGDRLWVRETFRYAIFGLGCGGRASGVEYKTGDIKFTKKAQKYATQSSNKDKNRQHARWRSPIFMPKWAARLWLEITRIRVERVQEISIRDLRAEGIDMETDHGSLCISIETAPYANDLIDGSAIKTVFTKLWDSLNAKRGYGWEKNPWVWCIEFKRLKDGDK